MRVHVQALQYKYIQSAYDVSCIVQCSAVQCRTEATQCIAAVLLRMLCCVLFASVHKYYLSTKSSGSGPLLAKLLHILVKMIVLSMCTYTS
jgi:VanZ family protein